MHIGFVVSHLSHGSPGSFERTRMMCKHLDKLGIRSTILTPFEEDVHNIHDIDMELIPNALSGTGLSTLGYGALRKFSSYKLLSKIFLSDLSLKRMVKSISVGLSQIMRTKKFDIINAVQPIAGLACIPVVKENDIPLVTDIHNIWPEELLAEGLIKRDDRTFRRLQEYERNIVNASHSVTVVSELMKGYVSKHYSLSDDSIVVVPPAGTIMDPLPHEKRLRNVVYAGMVNKREHVDLFANSMPYVTKKSNFYISNYGDSLKVIKRITSKKGFPEVNYVWFQQKEKIVKLLMTSLIGTMPSLNNLPRQMGPALKMFEYMSCGLPVIANDIKGWTEVISKEKIGILTEDDPKSFAEAIDQVLEDKELWTDMSQNCVALVYKKYNWHIITKELLIPMFTRLVQ